MLIEQCLIKSFFSLVGLSDWQPEDTNRTQAKLGGAWLYGARCTAIRSNRNRANLLISPLVGVINTGMASRSLLASSVC